MKKITLGNGLRIMLENVCFGKSATLGVWVASGSRYENANNSGVAHFIEHMIFKGTLTKSAKQLAQENDEIGGGLNAFTSKEYTCFYTRALSEVVCRAFETIAEMITSPKFDSADIETEKGVILEEINMYEDSPEDLCIDNLHTKIWNGTLSQNILGTTKTVSEMTRETIVDFKNRMYVPERMVVSICGNFNEDEFISLCKKHFENLENTNNALSTKKENYDKSIIIKEKDFEQTQVVIAFPAPALGNKDRYAISILHGILGGSSSSRLYQRIREELGLVYTVDSFSTLHLQNSLLNVGFAVSIKNEKKALDEIFKVLEEFKKGVTDEELKRAKKQYRCNLLMSMESFSSITSHMGSCEVLQNKTISIDEISKGIEDVTTDDINRLSNEILDIKNVSISVVGNTHNRDFYYKYEK